MDKYVVELARKDAYFGRSRETNNKARKLTKSGIYTNEIFLEKDFGAYQVTVIYLKNEHNPLEPLIFQDSRFWYLLSGYVIEDLSDSNIAKYFKTDSDCRPVSTSLGGIYSYATIRKVDGQISAGQSLPTWEPIYYSHTEDVTTIGNDPLVVHRQHQKKDRPVFSEDYALHAMQSGGVPCSDVTPFQGCSRLSAKKQLIARPDGAIRIQSTPAPSYGFLPTDGFNNRVNSYADCLNYSSAIFKKLPPPQFQVSGGRDSRMLAAMFIANDIDVIPESKSIAWSHSGQIADMVAKCLGHSACRRGLEEVFPDTPNFHELTMEKIQFQSGLASLASTQYPARLGGHMVGHPMVYGHGHHPRGGLARIRNREEAQQVIGERLLNVCLSNEVREEPVDRISCYVDRVKSSSRYWRSLAQHAYMDLPLDYHYCSFQAYFSNWHTPIMPLSDERFTLYCRDLADAPSTREYLPHNRLRFGEMDGMYDMQSDRLAMEATFRLAPELLEFPLENNRYQIERQRPYRYSKAAKWFELRDPSRVLDLEKPSNYVPRHYYPDIDAASRHIWSYLESTKMTDFFERVTRQDVVEFVKNPSIGTPKTVATPHLKAHIWSVYGLAIIFNSDWHLAV